MPFHVNKLNWWLGNLLTLICKMTKYHDTSSSQIKLEAGTYVSCMLLMQVLQCPKAHPVARKKGTTSKCSRGSLNGTYFDRKSRREFQFDEISQSCEMSARSGHEVNDGNDLLHKGERKVLTHPQRGFEPAGFDGEKTEDMTIRQGNWILCHRLDNSSFLTLQSSQLPYISILN